MKLSNTLINKSINFSNCGFRFGFHAGVIDQLINNKIDFKVKSGIGGGAIALFCWICGDWEKTLEAALKISPKDVLGVEPRSFLGLIKAVRNIRSGCNGLYDLEGLKNLLLQVCNKDIFNLYCREVSNVYIGVSNRKSDIIYFDITKMRFEEALDIVIDSNRITGLTSFNKYLSGGYVDGIGTQYILKKFPEMQPISVFARTKKINSLLTEENTNMFDAYIWSTEKQLRNNSFKSEKTADILTSYIDTLHLKYFMIGDRDWETY